MASFSHALSLFLLLLLAASSTSPTVHAHDSGNRDRLTHIHLYMHETSSGPNSTIATMVASPLGGNSSFGSLEVDDNELRTGPDPASSELLGRFQGLFIGTGQDSSYTTPVTLVFTAGEYAGSTLSIHGIIHSFDEPFERIVLGGTGKFRLSRGYSITKIVGNPTPNVVVFEIDLFVLMY